MSSFEKKRFVYFKDTDAAGIVYFARFFDFAHEALEEHLETMGLAIPKILAEGKHLWPITRSECTYTSPVRLNDRLNIAGRICANGEHGIKTTSTIYNTTTERESGVVIIEHTFISAIEWKKIPIPDPVKVLIS